MKLGQVNHDYGVTIFLEKFGFQDAFCSHSISFPELRSPWPAVGKRELWEHPCQACAIDTIDEDCALRSETGCAEFGYFLCYFKIDAPRALVFPPLVKGKEALGTRLVHTKTQSGVFKFLRFDECFRKVLAQCSSDGFDLTVDIKLRF